MDSDVRRQRRDSEQARDLKQPLTLEAMPSVTYSARQTRSRAVAE